MYQYIFTLYRNKCCFWKCCISINGKMYCKYNGTCNMQSILLNTPLEITLALSNYLYTPSHAAWTSHCAPGLPSTIAQRGVLDLYRVQWGLVKDIEWSPTLTVRLVVRGVRIADGDVRRDFECPFTLTNSTQLHSTLLNSDYFQQMTSDNLLRISDAPLVEAPTCGCTAAPLEQHLTWSVQWSV
jgi:hypothetical protein